MYLSNLYSPKAMKWTELVIVLFFLSIMQPQAKADEYHVAQQELWKQMPMRQLQRLSDNYLYKKHMVDSALLGYSILANAYFERDLKGDDLGMSTYGHYMLGNIYADELQDYQKAMGYFLQANDMAEQANFKHIGAHIKQRMANLENIFQLMTNEGWDTLSLQRQKDVFYAAYEAKEWAALTPAFANLLSDAAASMTVSGLEDEIALFQRTNIPDTTPGLDFARKNLEAYQAICRKDYEHALQCFTDLTHYSDRRVHYQQQFRQVAYREKLNLYYSLDRMDNALALMDTIIEESKRDNDHEALYNSYLRLFQYYDKIGDTVRAKDYMLSTYIEKDFMMSGSNIQDIGLVKYAHKLHKANEEVRQLAYKRHVQQRVLWGVLAFTLIIIGFSLALYYNYRQLKRKNRELYQKNLDLLASDEEKRLLLVKTQDNVASGAKHEPDQHDQTARQELLIRIIRVMETSNEVYSESFNVDRLAELVGERSYIVSQAINEQRHQNFYTLLGEYRVKEACRRLNNQTTYGHLTIEAVAQSVGFKSRSNFVQTFKKFTGLTPSVYQRLARQ